MPELPEVETIRRQLEKIVPFEIKDVTMSDGFKKNVLKTELSFNQKKVIRILRKGKILRFIFDDNTEMLSHLGMTGTWLIQKKFQEDKHNHLVLKIINKNQKLCLIYNDPRRFGKVYYENQDKIKHRLNKTGLDLTDHHLNFEYILKALSCFPEKPIKVLLLDQKIFAGSGNYIANEICAYSNIRPQRKCKTIKSGEIHKIVTSISKVIKPAIKAGGTTFQGGYKDTTGKKGKGLSNLVVFYQKICGLCHQEKIKKIYLQGRGTYYCPECQK